MKSVGLDNQKFAEIVEKIRAFPVRPDITLIEVPAPTRLAPNAFAVTAEASDPDDDNFSGRFVVLHDPDLVEEWQGNYRIVIFFRAVLEPDVLNDDLIRQVAWTWVQDSTSDVQITELGGTVTTNFGESFGSLQDRPSDGFVEVRASWTPVQIDSESPADNLAKHLQAWISCLELAGGLTPLSDGVTPVSAARRRG